MPWDEHGWPRALDALKLEAQSWNGVWVLMQYTALAWSARGFPRRFLTALQILRAAGARVAVVFHDVAPFAGTRLIDRLRRACQLRVMLAALRLADQSIVTIALANVRWLPARAGNVAFIPVGANLPVPPAAPAREQLHFPPAVGVFGITGGASGERETRDIVAALKHAARQLGALRLLAFGRHAELRESALREGLQGSVVELSVEGIVGQQELIDRFSAVDVLLFVRGQISSRRGSAIAGIACGVPVVAVRGEETAPPITDAGVVLLQDEPDDDLRQRALGASLASVLLDQKLRAHLIQRNRTVQEQELSWRAIAARYAAVLNCSR